MSLLGPLAAFGSSCTWAFSSTRYAQASRELGSSRVNLLRALTVVPIYAVLVTVTQGRSVLSGVTLAGASWLLASVMCSYAIADNLFFTSARRLGVPTALSIASTYPLWAALEGALVGGERFGPLRVLGTLLCVGGVIALVRLSSRPPEEARDKKSHLDLFGLGLAFAASFLWAGNSISVKHGAAGLTVLQANFLRYSMALPILAAQVALVSKARGAAPPPKSRPHHGWAWLLPAILTDAIFGSIFYVYGLSHTDLAVGSTLSSLAPLISVPVAILAGEERWNPPRFAAVTATVTGVLVLVAG